MRGRHRLKQFSVRLALLLGHLVECLFELLDVDPALATVMNLGEENINVCGFETLIQQVTMPAELHEAGTIKISMCATEGAENLFVGARPARGQRWQVLRRAWRHGLGLLRGTVHPGVARRTAPVSWWRPCTCHCGSSCWLQTAARTSRTSINSIGNVAGSTLTLCPRTPFMETHIVRARTAKCGLRGLDDALADFLNRQAFALCNKFKSVLKLAQGNAALAFGCDLGENEVCVIGTEMLVNELQVLAHLCETPAVHLAVISPTEVDEGHLEAFAHAWRQGHLGAQVTLGPPSKPVHKLTKLDLAVTVGVDVREDREDLHIFEVAQGLQHYTQFAHVDRTISICIILFENLLDPCCSVCLL
mmetsp:Transcript_57897/g.134902  ORF Transcript_57897/g.134902 Transcript_57897/m.134902 type:complete len:361 (+) Transcript_57897:180-1262(+)